MESNPEKRNNARIDHKCLVTIENSKEGIIYRAKMLNFSATGLYFEADNLLQPGEEIFVGINDSPFASSQGIYECYRVTIVWRKKLVKSAFYYGYGAKHTIDSHNVDLQNGETKKFEDIRRHHRKSYAKSIRFSAKNRIFEGSLRNISSAGVFIEADKNFEAGQIVTFELPLKKRMKAKVTGKIIWSRPDGFGVKFLSVDKHDTA